MASLHTSLRLGEELAAGIDAAAAAAGQDRATWIREACMQRLARQSVIDPRLVVQVRALRTAFEVTTDRLADVLVHVNYATSAGDSDSQPGRSSTSGGAGG